MKISTNLLLLFGTYSHVSAQSEITTEGAVAEFGSNGIDGQIKVINGHILMNLTFDDNFDFDEIGGTSCFTGGMYFGIYDTWEYDEYNDKLGTTNCGSTYTGYRWDPWMACSTLSANEYCESYDDGCVPPSSYKWDADEYEYLCNDLTYVTDPFVCEYGDLSGKYGLLELSDGNNYEILRDYTSAFEVDSYDLGGKSIVFRCHDNSRAFCAGFEEYTPTTEEIEDNIRPYQNKTFSQRAQIGTNSYVLLTYYQEYRMYFDSGDMDVPGNCGDEIYYRIFTDWDETGDDCTELSKFFYDPTLVCADDTENNDDDGKGYCEDYYYLCQDSDYTYSCAASYSEDKADRLQCSPSDLSAKYGSIDVSDNVNFKVNISGYDPKMIPLSKLEGKSIVLQCSSDNAIIACAPFEDYYDDVGKTINQDSSEDDDEDDEDDSGSSNNSSDDSFLGVSNTVVLIMVVLALAAIVPCIKGWRNRKTGSATGVKDSTYDTKTGSKNRVANESRSNVGGTDGSSRHTSVGATYNHGRHSSRSQSAGAHSQGGSRYAGSRYGGSSNNNGYNDGYDDGYNEDYDNQSQHSGRSSHNHGSRGGGGGGGRGHYPRTMPSMQG